MEYLKYQHVERLGRSETRGILDGRVYVFPKIDGTNAHVWFDGEKMRFGSRRRELGPGADNAGFMAWASQQPKLEHICRCLGPGWHLYGEWLVPHTLKTYTEDAWRRFYIFDAVHEETGEHLKYEVLQDVLEVSEYEDYIAPLRILLNPTPEDIIKCLDENDFLIQDGLGKGEGVVVKNYDYKNQYGRQTWGKVVSSEFKASHRRTMGAPVSKCTECVEPKIVEAFLTKAMIDKVVARIRSDNTDLSYHCKNQEMVELEGKDIPKLLGIVWHDFVTEELFAALKKFKNPTINFKYLNQCVIKTIKEMRDDLF